MAAKKGPKGKGTTDQRRSVTVKLQPEAFRNLETVQRETGLDMTGAVVISLKLAAQQLTAGPSDRSRSFTT